MSGGVFDQLDAIAQATGQTVFLGVRPSGRGWFVHCEGIEFDLTEPAEAATAIADALARKARGQLADSERKAAEARAALAALGPVGGQGGDDNTGGTK